MNKINPSYIDAPYHIAMNSHAKVGLAINYPPQSIGWLKGHDVRVLVTVCESNRIPGDWLEACQKASLIVVPSEFCRKVFAEAGFKTPIMVVRHGVDDHFPLFWEEKSDTMTGGHGCRGKPPFRLLHVSGARTFPQRKGTPQLLLAFRKISRRYPVHLYLKMDPTDELKRALIDLGLRGVSILPQASIPTHQIRAFLRSFDAVVQPSRGEGMGIIPLESRCSGVPAVLTNATGHTEHFVHGVDVEVHTGHPRPLKAQGNEIGQAPYVSVEAVEEALEVLLEDLPGHRRRTEEWARVNTANWTWRKVLEPLVRELRPHAKLKLSTPGAWAGARGYE